MSFSKSFWFTSIPALFLVACGSSNVYAPGDRSAIITTSGAADAGSSSATQVTENSGSPSPTEPAFPNGATLSALFQNNYASGLWNSVATLPAAVQLPFAPTGFSGDNSYGMLIAGGAAAKTVAYNANYAAANWTLVSEAPFAIEHLTGSNAGGPVISNGSGIAYMNNYSENQWHQVAGHAPWNIGGMAGNNSNGVVAFGAAGHSQEVAYMSNYGLVWHPLPSPPFPVIAIAGDNTYGAIVLGKDNGNRIRLAYMPSYDIGIWYELPVPSQNLTMITGDNHYGVAVSDGHTVWVMSNYASAVWSQLTLPPVQHTIVGLGGENSHGVIVLGY